MKKIIALVLVTVMLAFAVVSCTGGGNNETTTASGSSNETVPTKAETTTTSAATTTTTEAETTTTTTTTTTNPPVVVVPTDKNPIVHITFDELTDDLVFKDKSGNGHDAVANKALELVEGHDGKAVSFTKLNQHVEIADSDDFKLSKSDSFTIDVWFKWSGNISGTNWPCIIQKGLVQSKDLYKYVGFWVNYTDKKLNLGVTSSTDAKYSNNPAGEEVGTKWHHAVAVQDAEAGTISYYYDDVLVIKLPAIDASSKDCPFTIGYNGSDGQFVGAIDELKIYNYAVDMSK